MTEQQARQAQTPGDAVGRRVVVRIAADTAPPSVLMRVLARREVAVVLCTDEPAVMAELAHGPAVAVVLAEAPAIERTCLRDELQQAVQRYYPTTQVWVFGRPAGGPPQVWRYGEAPRATPAARKPARAPIGASRRRPAPQREPESPLISEEEMQMLLAPMPHRPASQLEGE